MSNGTYPVSDTTVAAPHVPAVHVPPAQQERPQLPQFAESVLRLASQPLPATPSQSA